MEEKEEWAEQEWQTSLTYSFHFLFSARIFHLQTLRVKVRVYLLLPAYRNKKMEKTNGKSCCLR